jgi:hypothetical protein
LTRVYELRNEEVANEELSKCFMNCASFFITSPVRKKIVSECEDQLFVGDVRLCELTSKYKEGYAEL